MKTLLKKCHFFCVAFAGIVAPVSFFAAQFSWPTDMQIGAETAWTTFVQPTVSGKPESGLFGNTRNDGYKFHEGIDIRAGRHDRKGEPLDNVLAVMPGQVVHIAATPNGPYGRYIVLSHEQNGFIFYTLYAHLRSVTPTLKERDTVPAGAIIGGLGRSDGTGGFAKERAHLHFEIGVYLNSNFPAWYARQKSFSTPNLHGIWNGLNLTGTDPLPFLRQGLRTGAIQNYAAVLQNEPVAVSVTIATTRIPNFVLRHKFLVNGPVPSTVAGWKIDFAPHGLPVRWTPLAVAPSKGDGLKSVKIELSKDPKLLRYAAARNLLLQKNGAYAAGSFLQTSLEILFDF